MDSTFGSGASPVHGGARDEDAPADLGVRRGLEDADCPFDVRAPIFSGFATLSGTEVFAARW